MEDLRQTSPPASFLVDDPDFCDAAFRLDRRQFLILAAVGATVLSTLLEAQNTHAIGWGGHTNGGIPSSALSPVPAKLGPFLRSDAAAAYHALAASFAARFGQALAITEGYRDYARQQYLYDGWMQHRPGFNLAARPGTSKHGWALACDFGAGVDRYGSPQKKWMDATAPSFGWSPTGNGFASREAWHFDFTGSYSPPPEDDLPYSEAQLKVIVREAMIGILRAPEFNIDSQASRLWAYKTSDMPGRAWETIRDARQIARRAEIEGQNANAKIVKLAKALGVTIS